MFNYWTRYGELASLAGFYLFCYHLGSGVWSEEADYLNEKRDHCTVDHYITNSCRPIGPLCLRVRVSARAARDRTQHH